VQRGLLVLMAAGALALPSQVPVGSDDVGSPVKRLAPEAPVTYAVFRSAIHPDRWGLGVSLCHIRKPSWCLVTGTT